MARSRYGKEPRVKERFREVLATLAVSAGASAGREGARLLLAEGIERAAASKLARKIFGRFLARRLPVVVPLIGTLAGGTINDLSMRAVGNAARNFYEAKPARKAPKRKAKRPRSSRRRTEAGR